jgi:hypothetical protein
MGTIADKYANSLLEIGCKPALYAAITALEDRIDALQPSQPDSTGKDEREWMPKDIEVWRAYFNPSTNEWTIDRANLSWIEPGELWMPYRPGDSKPAAPEVK